MKSFIYNQSRKYFIDKLSLCRQPFLLCPRWETKNIRMWGIICYLLTKSRLTLLWPPWTVVLAAPLSIGFPSNNTRVSCYIFFSRRSSDPGIELKSIKLESIKLESTLAGGFFTTEPPGIIQKYILSLPTVPGTELLKPLAFPSDRSIFCYSRVYASHMTLGRAPR